jgi:hypothetical protein
MQNYQYSLENCPTLRCSHINNLGIRIYLKLTLIGPPSPPPPPPNGMKLVSFASVAYRCHSLLW